MLSEWRRSIAAFMKKVLIVVGTVVFLSVGTVALISIFVPRSTPSAPSNFYTSPPVDQTDTARPVYHATPVSDPPKAMPFKVQSDVVQVKGYYRSDGTYVKPHTRKKSTK